MRDTNCHNCGAAKNLGGVQCEYCDTVFRRPRQTGYIYDPRAFDPDDLQKPVVPIKQSFWEQLLASGSSVAVTMMMLPRRY